MAWPSLTHILIIGGLLAGRTEPYRGYEGLAEYIDDISGQWKRLELQPQHFLPVSSDRVLVFGRVRAWHQRGFLGTFGREHQTGANLSGAQGQRHGQRVGGRQLRAALQLGFAGLLQVAQPVEQRAAHLLGLQAHFGGFTGGHDPVVQGLQAGRVVLLPSGDGLCQHRHVATRLRQVQLVHHPVGGAEFVVHQALIDGRFQTFGVREAADRQSR